MALFGIKMALVLLVGIVQLLFALVWFALRVAYWILKIALKGLAYLSMGIGCGLALLYKRFYMRRKTYEEVINQARALA